MPMLWEWSLAVSLISGGLAGALFTYWLTPKVQRKIQRIAMKSGSRKAAIDAVTTWIVWAHRSYFENEAPVIAGTNVQMKPLSTRTIKRPEYISLGTQAAWSVKGAFASVENERFLEFRKWFETTIDDKGQPMDMHELYERVEHLTAHLSSKVWDFKI